VDRISPRMGDADRVICMSAVLREACISAGVGEEKIVVLGNRVSTRRFRPGPQPGYDPQTIRTLLVGRLEEQKNIHGVAAALALLKGRGWKVRLDVCGGVGRNRYLRRAFAVLEASDYHYWGAVPNRELPPRYRAVDMYVGPSLFEGFQIPLIEALACGKPCVVSDQPPATEIISAQTGWAVDPHDPESIAQGIEGLKQRLNDERVRRQIGEACRREAVRRWSYRVISDREAAIYLEVCGPASTCPGGREE